VKITQVFEKIVLWSLITTNERKEIRILKKRWVFYYNLSFKKLIRKAELISLIMKEIVSFELMSVFVRKIQKLQDKDLNHNFLIVNVE
jgi:hypothetical protein